MWVNTKPCVFLSTSFPILSLPLLIRSPANKTNIHFLETIAATYLYVRLGIGTPHSMCGTSHAQFVYEDLCEFSAINFVL